MRVIHFPSLRRVGWIVPVALVLAWFDAGRVWGLDDRRAAARRRDERYANNDDGTTATPGGTPVSSVPPTDAITLTTDHASYTTSSTIIVTLINGRSTSIFTFDHQTSCTILTLQRQTTTGWQPRRWLCAGAYDRAASEVKAGATMKITLAPGAGQMHRHPGQPEPIASSSTMPSKRRPYQRQPQVTSADCLLSGKSVLASLAPRFQGMRRLARHLAILRHIRPGVYNRGVAAHGRAQQR